MKKLFSVVLALILSTVCLVPCFAGTVDSGLNFASDGSFTILHLTDTQDDQYPAYDMLNLVKRAIEESDPDLIVFTGDLVEDSRAGDLFIDDESGREGVCVESITGELDYDKTLANIVTAADAVLSIFQDSGVPFVIAQGNNDHKCGITNETWLEIYSKYSNCLVVDESDDADGRIDYNVILKNTDGEPVFNLWLMDTGRGGVNDDQIEWYKNRSAEITAQNGKVIPAIVFQHIHLADIGNLFEKCNGWDEGAEAIGVEFYRLNKDIASGENYYAYEPGKTTAEFTAWKECGDVIGAFFGHQHYDGFSGVWQGIELGFTYGCEFAKTGPYGYRVITLHEDDVTNYDNDVYVYSGNVRLGTDKIEKQTTSSYDENPNSFLAFLSKVKNFMFAVVTIIKGLFA